MCRNILCQINDWNEVRKFCQNLVGTIAPVPIHSTGSGQSKSGIDRFSRIFGKVFSRGNFWVLCIFACKKIRPGENFSCNKAISKPDVWAFEETFWSRHSTGRSNTFLNLLSNLSHLNFCKITLEQVVKKLKFFTYKL